MYKEVLGITMVVIAVIVNLLVVAVVFVTLVCSELSKVVVKKVERDTDGSVYRS